MRSLTLTLVISGFLDDKSNDFNQLAAITPDQATRFAFDKANGYGSVEISNETGPVNDGKLELIDVIKLDADQIDTPDTDCALIVRVQSTRSMDSYAAQKLGEAIEAYMSQNGVTEFATAAIGDMDVGQDLHGKWNTLLLTRNDKTGQWSFKNLRFTSVQKSTDDGFAVLSGTKLGKIDGATLVSTLLDADKLQQILDGYQLERGKYHLVRAPIKNGGAYAVVGQGFQTVYNDQFQVVASAQNGFTVMPAIDVDGEHTNEVTTVSGNGDKWDVRKGIDPRKADALAPAYANAA